jgi:Carboxypeptidase regulatory-like domain
VVCAVQSRRGMGAAIENSRAYPVILYPNASSTENATPLSIDAGAEEIANFSLIPAAAHVVKGKVIGAEDGNTNISLAPVSGGFAFFGGNSTRVAEDGTFELKSVLPGTYWLNALNFSASKQESAGKKITVGDTDLNGVVLNFQSTSFEVHGNIRLLGNTARDLTNTVVYMWPAVTESSAESDNEPVYFSNTQVEVKKDGSFTMFVGRGSRRLFPQVVSSFGYKEGWYLKAVYFGGRDVTDTGFIPVAGVNLLLTYSPDSGQVNGVVTDKDGHPAPGADVVLVPDESRRSRQDLYERTVSDQLGQFHIRGVAPGTYKAFALEDLDGDEYLDSDFLKEHLSAAQDIKVEEKGSYTVDLKLSSTSAEK